MLAAIEGEICEDHARQASVLWLLRDAAVRGDAHDLASLARLDDRVEAHLDGLRVGGDAGWEACRALLRDPQGGEVFGAAVIAVERWDLRGLAKVLDAGARAPDLSRGLASALGWTPFERVKRLLPGLFAARCPPALHWLGISACAAHRQDPGGALGNALASREPRLRARALRAAGELGRADVLPEIREALQDPDDGVRFWSAWSAALFGEAAAAGVLWTFATGGGVHAERAACAALRRMDPAAGCASLLALAEAAPRPRVPLVAAAALGDPAIVPWLLERMADEKAARRAAWALSLITGVDLARESLAGAPPEGFRSGPTDDPADPDVAMDPDERLPWPDLPAVQAWWQRRAGGFARGTRHLLGRPIAAAWMEQVLREGPQPARAMAAEELRLRVPRRPLFEVRAPAFQQRRALGVRPRVGAP